MSADQQQRLATAVSNRYQVTREIGRGGMATVYLAQDLKHRRQVAIKVFAQDVAAALGNERFLREIELTAGLTHPNILTLHDSGIAEGLLYYVMPYIQGESLRDYMSRKGRLSVSEALQIGKAIADALAFAHRKGIVHRDIKPENILLQDGHAYVADFGIARTVSLAGNMALTQTGVVIGTPAYMSPEQTAGESGVDGRSDIYSLACVLFEALSGSPPFTGSSVAALATRRLTEAAPRLRTIVSDIPLPVDEALSRALARDPKERFATAEEFAAALTVTAGVTSARGAAKGIVVLPFGNLSPDPENEFFADGLTEEVIADLSGIRALRVISRTSAMRFKGTNKDLRDIARELDVRYVLEGSVRRAGTSLRVTAQLIDAESDSHLWAEKYSGNVADVFAIQEEISRKIVNALEVHLTEKESRGIAERPIDNAAAYDCYMKAQHEVYSFTRGGLDRAKKLADAGLSLIGENPLLLAARGMVSWYYLNFSIDSDERYLDEAADFARRALAQDSQNFFGIFLRGLVAAKRGDLISALPDFLKAHDLKPGDSMVLGELNRHLMSGGFEHKPAAWALVEEAERIDPLNALGKAQLAFRHFVAGRHAEVAASCRRILELADTLSPPRVYAAYYLALINLRDEALAIFDEEQQALGNTPYALLSRFLGCALRKDANGAADCVTPELERAARWTEYLSLMLGDGYALIGNRDKAVYWLRSAIERGFVNYNYLAQYDPLLASIRGDAEFKRLIEDVRQRWQALQAVVQLR